MLKTKYKLRALPILIFIAVLSLSIKINNIYDILASSESKKISISHSSVVAKEKKPENSQSSNVVSSQSTLEQLVNREYNDTNNPMYNNKNTSEIKILKDLAERREMLDLKSKEIDKKALQLKVVEEQIDKKIKQLQTYEEKLKAMINKYNQEEQTRINSLVKMYSAMKTKDAARLFNSLDNEIVLPILKAMKPSSASAILSQMDNDRAKIITLELMGTNID